MDAACDMLDREQKGELLEMIIDAIRNDGSPTTDDRYVRGVFNQFMSVIERKANGYAKRQEALDKVNAEKSKVKPKEEVEVSVYTDKSESISVDDFVKYLNQIWNECGQSEFDRKFNDLSIKYGFNKTEVYNRYKEVYG